VVTLPRAVAAEMIAHARAGLPNEACGVLAGDAEGNVSRFVAAENADASPFRYRIDGPELLRVVLELEEAEEELVAIYHSHTRSPAFPSRTDLEQARHWPDPAYVIVSFQRSDDPEVKAFHLRDGTIADCPLEMA
jgi:proteasome lid subunit RPN8/RPN11